MKLTTALILTMLSAAPAHANHPLVLDHDKHGRVIDAGYTEGACYARIATIITRVAIPTGKPYSYNGLDYGWGHDSNGRFTLRCVLE